MIMYKMKGHMYYNLPVLSVKPCAHWINVEVQTNFGGHCLSGFMDMVQI